ncbi:MAG TPA: cache domain-containing protein [bacterium]
MSASVSADRPAGRGVVRRLNDLKLRWKLLLVVLPLATLPALVVGTVVGFIATRQAYRGITQTSKDDLEHMARFAIDLLNAHYQQFEVYRADKKQGIDRELATLVNLAYNLVESEERQRRAGRISREAAQREARKALKSVKLGATGYLYAMTGDGLLTVHVAQEGQNIAGERDERGRYFIREMCAAARASAPGEVLHIVYPWRNPSLGDTRPRKKAVAYRYFREWDWIVAAGGYLDETYEDVAFENRAFDELKARLKSKRVGRTGYIYALSSAGDLRIHVDREGENIIDARDESGRAFIREICEKKSGWIRYPWKNVGDARPRMKIVRYEYFEPWDWIVAVGSYEDEFYAEANLIRGRIFWSMAGLTTLAVLVGTVLVFHASRVLTVPIEQMIAVIRRVKRGRLDERMPVRSNDELGELAATFNRMVGIIERNQEMETTLAQHEKMASLGVLSSAVAHEINNPLGVILGYAAHLEGKMDPKDPSFRYIQDIRRESKRCKGIVQDLLSYARTPKPALEETDLTTLLDQIADFAANHLDLSRVRIAREFAPGLPPVCVDPDQIRQVAINLILNAGAAMEAGGTITVGTAPAGPARVEIFVRDQGCGIAPENLEKIFEPFFTTKARGTGLGLAITRRIIEQHQGTITVESAVGVGTTVRVCLPVEREEI